MGVEREHVGMDGKPCQCTPRRRTNARRGCAPTCFCHGLKHAKCPNAKPCLGRCGRLTTSGETSACGYCAHCAADGRWVELDDGSERTPGQRRRRSKVHDRTEYFEDERA